MPDPSQDAHRSRGLGLFLVALLVLHLLLGALRIPGVVVARRCGDVADYQRRGAAGFFLGGPHQHGADVVEWILANVPADGVVLFRGDSKGSLEFVPGLIAPRLLVMDSGCLPGAVSYAGRPLASRHGPGGDRVVVVQALGNQLRLEDR